MVYREKAPGGVNALWFTAHANTRHGGPLDIGDEGLGTAVYDHPYLGFLSILFLPKYPTAEDIKERLFGVSRYRKVDLYLNPYNSQPERDTAKVDLNKHGLTKHDHLVFVDRNYDKTESKAVKDERDDESITRQLNKDAKYKTFTKRLKNITHGDWSIYPEAINTKEGEILWTDGNSNHSFTSAPTIQAYEVVKRYPNTLHGSVMEHGFASTSPYYFELLD